MNVTVWYGMVDSKLGNKNVSELTQSKILLLHKWNFCFSKQVS